MKTDKNHTVHEPAPPRRDRDSKALKRIRRGSLSRRLWSGSRRSVRISRSSNRDYTSFFPEGVA